MCHTGARSKGKPAVQIFSDDGQLNASAPKEKISQALADGKMPPANRPRPSADDLKAIQDWINGK
jgi:hypothetical protein